MKTTLSTISNVLSRSLLRCALVLTGALLATPVAEALPLSTYAPASVLSQGRWVKVSVEQTGVYALSRATLQRMGFANPERVRIYGYGAEQIDQVLSAEKFVDDLPQVQSTINSRGAVVFYAKGPETWRTQQQRYVRRTSFYTTRSYYFVTEVPDSVHAREIKPNGHPGETAQMSVFTERLQHESRLDTPGEAGAELVGEDFRLTPSRTFSFRLPDRAEGSQAKLECSFVTRTYNRSSTVKLTSGSTDIGSFNVGASVNEGSYFGTEGIGRFLFEPTAEKTDITLKHESTVTVNNAWLNYLNINYERILRLPSTGALEFRLSSTQGCLGGVGDAGVTVWDVTNPSEITCLQTSEATDGKVGWVNSYTGNREYVAFSGNANLPEPRIEGNVANQNLHALGGTNMIIVTLPQWSSQAQRIAEIHRNEAFDPLEVEVVDAQQIYNEFGSGAPDPGALRRFFKMVYDRGNADGKPLRYVLLMGRTTYDNSHCTEAVKALGYPTLPSHYPTGMGASLSDQIGYPNDDLLAMLEDRGGWDIGYDKLSVAIGRMPVRSLDEATQAVDKLSDYVNKSRNNPWRNRMLILADDGDNGVHMNQSNTMEAEINPDDKANFLIDHIYIDAYQRQGSTYPQAHEAMFRTLDEGVMFWLYMGHANPREWTADGQLTFNDINSLYLKNVPAVFAGTCEFLRWDSKTISGAEIMFHERFGGAIAMISAARPVYIAYNGPYAAALGRAFARRDANGLVPRIGDYFRWAANDLQNRDGSPMSDTNRLRYVLMGDPALKLVMPDNYVSLETVNNTPVTDDGEQVVIPALSRPRIQGSVTDPAGNIIADFNGTMQLTIYDAETSITTLGNGKDGEPVTYDEHGSKLFTGVVPVTNGRFDATVAMPAEISENFRPATINFYAYDPTNARHAAGIDKRVYVYGFDSEAPADTIAPKIDALYLNFNDFANGGTVNTSPTLIADVSDDTGINISSAGIGHQMTVQLDGKRSYNVASGFTPAADGSPAGQVVFPLENLTPGNHSLSFRVWDTSGNSAQREIDFFVDPKSSPKLYDVYTDANPASTVANFFITTDRPAQLVTVTVTVYNLLGHPLWSKTMRGVNDMFTTTPLQWNLCDSSGRRVQRGIYLYRASITDNGETFDTGSRRIAVTGQ